VPIPVTPRAIFARNVLAEVICQLRFPTILSISSADPSQFQDRVRETYPLYERDNSVDIPEELRGLLTELPIGGQQVRHNFSSADGKRAISLASDFLALTDRAYTRWENFGPEVLRALGALNDIYHPAFLTRVGLRYRDLVDKTAIPGIADTPWDQLINPTLIGPLGAEPLRNDVEAQQATVILRLDEVPNARVRIHHGTAKLKEGGHLVYFFDADFSVAERTEIANVEHILDTFHRASGNLFRWAISPALSQALQPNPIQ
jgi:uncharacterized protein (TIGR04255 family)